MVKALGRKFSHFSEKYMPEPIIFAILLTILTFLLGLFLTDTSIFGMVEHWYTGFWNLLTFAMQMVLVLVTGHALATAPQVKKFIEFIATKPKNSAYAAALTALVACVFSWINWALGLIVGALFALEVGKTAYKKGMKIHYPLIVAAGYSGQMVWHFGPSSSSGLSAATQGHFLEESIGIIPITETVFSSYALLNSMMFIFFVVPIIFFLLSPKKEEEMNGIEESAPSMIKENKETKSTNLKPYQRKKTFAERLDSRILTTVIVLMSTSYIFYHFYQNGFDLNLNIVNFIFLTLGLILHQTPMNYTEAIAEATKGASGIILQFPFYGGIMGMVSLSGLGVLFVDSMLSIATPGNFPILAWLSAGILNIFVPSGGGQWAIQGPFIAEVARELGVPIGKAIVAFSAGDTWTNMFQPFWAIALLGITGVKAKDIMGYCMVLLILAIPFYLIGLSLF